MEKIVPFKKNIKFEDRIYEITSISLEHTLSLKEENYISGKFIVSGTYKVTEASVNVLEFNYDLPFEITIDKKYDTKDVVVDINNFYYEVIDNEELSVNIDVVLENLEEREEILEDLRCDEVSQVDLIKEEDNKDEENIEQRDIFENSIFQDLDDNERYVTYKVHVVTENDTRESILEKYEITISELEKYNNLADLKIGDKVIIPSNE